MESSSVLSIISILRRIAPRPGLENQLAEDVRKILNAAGVPIDVESMLSKGRVDIRSGSTAIELKVKGSPSSVLRQLSRYSLDPAIQNIVLVTASAKLRCMPDAIEGKRLYVVYLPRL